MRKNYYILVFAMMLIGLGSFAQTEGTDKPVKVNQYGQAVETVDLDAEARNAIITFESEDGNYKFWMDNRIYFDGAYFFDEDALNPIGNGVTIRRARLAVKAKLHKNWYGEVDMDFAGSAVELKDAYLKYTTDAGNLNFKAGHFRESFSMETTTTSRYVQFIERSLPAKFSPSRHLGFQVNYIQDKYLLSGGVHFNTIGDYEEAELTQAANKDSGKDEGYSLTGRAVWRPIFDTEKVLHLGTAASFRTPKTHYDNLDSYRFSTRSVSNINRKKYLDTNDILNVDNRTLFNVEMAGAFKNIMFQTEYFNNDIKRTEGLSKINLNGFYAQVAYLLGDGKYRYNKNEGEFTQPGLGNKGEMEVAFRLDYLDLNDAKADIYGGSANAYTLGLNYYANTNVKFMINYSYLDHDRYANGKGKLYVGHDINGDLTKDPTQVVEAEGKAGDDYGQIQFRVEIDF